MGKRAIQSHRELEVYRLAFETAMKIFHASKGFPPEERYSLTDQVRRSSRAVCANLAEAWRKRRYEGSFLMKLNDAEAEAADTQTWLEFTVACGYLGDDAGGEPSRAYDYVIGMLVRMVNNPSPWLLPSPRTRR